MCRGVWRGETRRVVMGESGKVDRGNDNEFDEEKVVGLEVDRGAVAGETL